MDRRRAASLGIERAAFVGHSNGAFQTATYATERSERVERVAFLAPAATFLRISGRWWRASLPVMVGDNRQKIEGFWHTLSVNPEPSPLQVAADEQMVRAMVGLRSAMRDAWPRTYTAERLSRMTMPVLVVFGREPTSSATPTRPPRRSGLRCRTPRSRSSTAAT